jgi:D-sedoheptulose 7-phosphate isomerase
MNEFFNNYFQVLDRANHTVECSKLEFISEMIIKTNKIGGTIFIVGNGGSASIASHAAVDLTKAANITATTFNESSLLTCLANDYDYKHWVAKAFEFYLNPNDLVILISSSGQSENIINGAKKAKEIGVQIVTFSGFSAQNELRKMGNVNLWIDSSKYNIIEIVHQTWLLSIIDFIIDNKS